MLQTEGYIYDNIHVYGDSADIVLTMWHLLRLAPNTYLNRALGTGFFRRGKLVSATDMEKEWP